MPESAITGFNLLPGYGNNSPITITNSGKITAGLYGIYAGTGGDGNTISITNTCTIDPYVGIYAVTYHNNAIKMTIRARLVPPFSAADAQPTGQQFDYRLGSGRVTSTETRLTGPASPSTYSRQTRTAPS